MGKEVIIKGDIIIHADFPLKDQKNVKSGKIYFRIASLFYLIYKSIAPSFGSCHPIFYNTKKSFTALFRELLV
jgi:hypothetical protein